MQRPLDREQLAEQVRRLAPWHQNIQLTGELSIGTVFQGKRLLREQNGGVALINAQPDFARKVSLIYPQGLADKTFLDCACNAGAYCFWARELGARAAFGFDVRQGWIEQAQFVQQHRTVAPTDRIQFEQCDLYQLRARQLDPVDFTLFKGIFYHLPDPILGLKIAADLTKEILWFDSMIYNLEDKNCLYCAFEDTSHPMSGVHALSWSPTGSRVVVKLLHWLGFVDIRHLYTRSIPNDPRRSRLGMIAAKVTGLLDPLQAIEGVFRYDQQEFVSRTSQATRQNADLG